MIDFTCRNNYGGNSYPKDEEKWRREKVLEDLSAAKTNYFYLGAHLLDIWNTRTYGVHKFDVSNYSGANFFDYCNVNFKLDKSQVSRYMNIVSEFGDCLRGFKGEYKDYSYSLLTEMLPLTPKERKKVKPDWTIKQVRDYKKELAGESVATSQPKEKVYKIFGELKPSAKVSNVLDSTFHDFPILSKDNLPDFIDKLGDRLFVGYNYDGYGLSYEHKIKLIAAMIGFAFDISKSLESKDMNSFINVQQAFVQLKELGYIS